MLEQQSLQLQTLNSQNTTLRCLLLKTLTFRQPCCPDLTSSTWSWTNNLKPLIDVSLIISFHCIQLLQQMESHSPKKTKIKFNRTTWLPRTQLAKTSSPSTSHTQECIAIPKENVNVLVKCYTDMRSMGNNKKTITATPRQLESLIRIAESIARMRLSDRVEKSDIDEAVRLIKTAMQQSATDPKTGEIDMDIIATGVSATSMKRIKEVCEFIKKITVSNL